MYIDIQGHKINGGTLPPDIVVTSNRPDIVLVDRDNKEILLAELTCPFETNIDNNSFRNIFKKYFFSNMQYFPVTFRVSHICLFASAVCIFVHFYMCNYHY